MTYCTHGDVSNFLQIDAFSGSTTPTSDVVNTRILENAQYIDEYTEMGWHSNRYIQVTKEPLNMDKFRLTTVGHRGRAQTRYKPIAALNNFFVWTGNAYTDYVASGSYTAGSFTDPLSGDYWVDNDNGYIYLKSFPDINISGAANGVAAYATYTYGFASTPADIKKACILLTSSDITQNEEYGINFPEGSVGMDNQAKATLWSEEAHKILDLPSRHGASVTFARSVGTNRQWQSLMTR